MGTDDIFRKQRERKTADLERLHKDRTRRPRFLIVCEGKKTEPYYSQDFCEFHQLRTPRVRIAPRGDGSSYAPV